MRIRRPQLGPSDQIETPAQPDGGGARLDIASGQAATGSASPYDNNSHRALIELARLMGHQLAREASGKEERDD